jgi:hypothetical protein
MSDVFKIGDRVRAYTAGREIKAGTKYRYGGWFPAVVIGLTPDGRYRVRFSHPSESGKDTAVIDEDEIKSM